MAEQQNNPNHKRNHEFDDSDGEPDVKHQKRQNGDEEPEIESEPNSITNICFELLDRIFDSLDLKSLLNVAQTSKRLQIAAASQFKAKYGEIHINLNLGANYNKNVCFHLYGRVIDIFDSKFCLHFLRCFGSKVSNLHIARLNIDARSKTVVNQYISQYCANTLTRISFYSEHEFSNEIFKLPFQNVEQVGSEYINLSKILPNFVKWFPSVRHLSLEIITIACDFSTVSFPHLEHLSIRFFNEYYRRECLLNLLNANRQLKSFKISLGFNDKLRLSHVVDMLSEHTLLSKLEIEIDVFSGFSGFSGSSGATNANANELLRLASEHPQLVELNLHAYILTVADAIALTEQLPSLKIFRFRVRYRSEYENLQNRLSSKWQHNLSCKNLPFSYLIRITLTR